MSRSTVTGGAQLRRNLRGLAPGILPAISDASRQALKPMLTQAKGNLQRHKKTGKLIKSITVKKAPRSPTLQPEYQVAPARGKEHARLGHLLELGTAPHMVGGRMHPGQRPSPWLAPAFEATKDQALKIFAAVIGAAIEKQARKRAGR